MAIYYWIQTMRVRFLYFIFLAPLAGLVVVYIEMEIYESMLLCCAAFFVCSRPVVKGNKRGGLYYFLLCSAAAACSTTS